MATCKNNAFHHIVWGMKAGQSTTNEKLTYSEKQSLQSQQISHSKKKQNKNTINFYKM